MICWKENQVTKYTVRLELGVRCGRADNILTMPVAVTSVELTGAVILAAAREGESRYVCVGNVHMCMEAFDSSEFNAVVNGADLVVPDGKPLVWGLRALGAKEAGHVRGSDLLLHLCGRAEREGVAIGLYGGTPESLVDFQGFLIESFPGLQITYAASPPFRPLTPEETARYASEIRDSGARILFVGIGCPKQERWMAAHRGLLPCVMIGVGAAFDFFSGRKKHAPRWMQQAGLEWLFRLASDPGRLWKRYLKHNPRFIYHFGRQYFRHKFLQRLSCF